MSSPSSITHRNISQPREGGIGALRRAADTRLTREAAIRVLPDSTAADPGYFARFPREAPGIKFDLRPKRLKTPQRLPGETTAGSLRDWMAAVVVPVAACPAHASLKEYGNP